VAESLNKRTALIIASLASFLTPFMGSSINVALPAIGAEFRMDAVLLGWVQTAFLLSSAVLLVPIGRVADIHGRRRVFLYGIVLYASSSLLCGLAQTPGVLIGARAVQGISGAMMFGVSIAILSSVFPLEERGAALGINTASVYIGLSLGPFIGGFLTQQIGWRSIFLVQVPLGLLMVILVLTKLKVEWVEARGAKFDIAGSLAYSAALLLVLYGFSLLPGARGFGAVGAGVIGLWIFFRRERRVESPMLDVNLFLRNRAFSMSNLAALINYSATFAITFLLSLYLQYIRGFSPQQAGMILVAQPICMAAGSPFAGRLSDRVEPRIVASIGMAVLVIGLFLFALIGGETPLAAIIANLALVGVGFALFSSPNTNAVMSSVGKAVYGVAAGTLATMRLTGQALSLGIATLVLALFVGRVEITPESSPALLQSIRTTFMVSALLCVAGVLASLVRGSVRQPKER
jgi:EmrB/QacA subfamily drug resistance transporter